MSPLSKLPLEINDNIFSFFDLKEVCFPSYECITFQCWVQEVADARKGSLDTLLSLCRTSRKVQALAEPHLYRSWTQVYNFYGWSDARQRSLQGFLSAIIHRPELARHVHHVEAFNWSTDRVLGKLSHHNQDVLAAQTTEEADIAEQLQLLTRLKDGSADKLIALLLTKTPNLRSIAFALP